MPVQTGTIKSPAQPSASAKANAATQPQPPSAVPSSQPAVNEQPLSSDSPLANLRRQIPKFLLDYEPIPQEVFDENPVLTERSAAVLVGVTQSLMKKWRQRNWGPNYIQYGEDGPVRYEFAALMQFRNRHIVQVRSKR